MLPISLSRFPSSFRLFSCFRNTVSRVPARLVRFFFTDSTSAHFSDPDCLFFKHSQPLGTVFASEPDLQQSDRIETQLIDLVSSRPIDRRLFRRNRFDRHRAYSDGQTDRQTNTRQTHLYRGLETRAGFASLQTSLEIVRRRYAHRELQNDIRYCNHVITSV